uniref:Uncharacterized protein n=1 Tax=Aegilops tauschii subsp. strangulata TaxID=200361 RepID=A0A453BNX1_AEGTS
MHMQDMFKKERSKCRDYRTRNGHNPTYNQHSRREDWYEDAETFYANQRTNFRSRPREAMQYSMSHHYSVLGLNRSRPEPFSDAEIKRMRLGEKQWNTIQTKTKTTKRLLRKNSKRSWILTKQ